MTGSIPPEFPFLRTYILRLRLDRRDQLQVRLLLPFRFLSLRRVRLPLDMTINMGGIEIAVGVGIDQKVGRGRGDEEVPALLSSIQRILRSHQYRY